jgi:hypothetical protein
MAVGVAVGVVGVAVGVVEGKSDYKDCLRSQKWNNINEQQ